MATTDVHGQTFSLRGVAGLHQLLLDGGWQEDVPRLQRGLRGGLEPARALPGVADVRVLGAIGVVQLNGPVDVTRVTAAAVEAGVWLRPFRDLIYMMPPYVTTDADLAQITAAVVAGVGANATAADG